MNALLAFSLCSSFVAPVVHVDVEAASAAEARDLEAWLALRLVEEGYTTIEDPRRAEIRLRLLVRPREVWIEADGLEPSRERVDLAGDDVGRLEVLHRAIEAIERAQGHGVAEEEKAAVPVAGRIASAPGEPLRAVAPSKAVRPRSEPTALPPRSEPRFRGAFAGPFGARLGARAGFVGRKAAIDPLVAAGVRLGRDPGLGVRVDLQVWPTVPGPVRVVEIAAAGGPTLRIAAARRLDIDVGITAGALIHTWRLAAARGVKTDATFELSVAYDIAVGRSVSISIVPFFGVATRARSHVVQLETVWSRGALRGGLALGVGWGRPRPS